MHKRTIVTLCGSTRFRKAFEKANKELTLAGQVVLTVGSFDRNDDLDPKLKVELDLLHFDKIAMSDYILVLNEDGYIGDSTRREIGMAWHLGKQIQFLDNEAGHAWNDTIDVYKIQRETIQYLAQNVKPYQLRKLFPLE